MTTKLHSKFSIRHVIVEPIIIILLVIFLCFIITFASLNMVKDGIPLYKTIIWGNALFVLLLIWSMRYYLKTFESYSFLDRGFEVSNIYGKQFYSWQSVKEISIIENRYEKILWQYLNEDALCIQLKNGTTLELFSKYYSNMPDIRKLLSSKNQLNIINSFNEDNDKSVEFFRKRIIKGSFILSFNGILASGLILLSGFMLLTQQSSMTLLGFLFLLCIPTVILLFFGFQSYYFQLDQNYLIVKNHIFLHVKQRINLEKVKVIYFEQKFKKEPSIRIIDGDYSMVSFQGSTLKNKQWKSLMLSLKNHGIIVIDNLFYEYNE